MDMPSNFDHPIEISPDDLHDIAQQGYTAYVDVVIGLQEEETTPPLDQSYPAGWYSAVKAIISRLTSLGYARPPFTPITNWRHGTTYGYEQMQCKCAYCRDAGTVKNAAYNDTLNLQLQQGIVFDHNHLPVSPQPDPKTVIERNASH